MLQEVRAIEILIMNRVKYFQKEIEWLASALGKNHMTRNEHWRRGLQVWPETF